MSETKVSLSLNVPGAKVLSSQECEENPKESYDEHKITIEYFKGKSKRKVKETLTIHTRKQKLITQNINICEEAYKSMLETPTSTKYTKLIKGSKTNETKRIWDIMSEDERLKKHFDLIASNLGAKSYSYKVLGD